LDIPSSRPCSSIIYAADFPLTNLQPYKFVLPIYPTVGMAASTLRHCFGQPAKMCALCTFNTVTATLFLYLALWWGYFLASQHHHCGLNAQENCHHLRSFLSIGRAAAIGMGLEISFICD
jgi:hypothetical protein